MKANLSRFLIVITLPACAQASADPQTISQDPNDWPMYNHDPQGSRYNPSERILGPDTVLHLRLKWFFPTSGDIYATPAVVDGIVYAGDTSGTFYALTSSGALLWKTVVGAPITASALVTSRMAIFGDQAGVIHGLERASGKPLWSARPNPHPLAAIYGSPVWVNGQIAIGISSNEDSFAAAHPGYICCTFRGSVVRLNPEDGAVVWQTYLITDAEFEQHASGASVWSTPTYDAATGVVYVTTANNYTAPTTATSDAFIALNATTGAILWVRQTVAGDTGNVEADFGDSSQIYTLPGGRKAIGAGQKQTGLYYVVDAADGAIVSQNAAVPSCKDSEGLFADSAVAEGLVVFVNGVDCTIFSNPPLIPPTGKVIALTANATKKRWEFTSWFAPVLSGVGVANGVVYFESSGLLSILYALDTRTGKVLKSSPIAGSISGPSISRGEIYLGMGTKFASGFGTLTGIVALGL